MDLSDFLELQIVYLMDHMEYLSSVTTLSTEQKIIYSMYREIEVFPPRDIRWEQKQ